MASSFLRGKPKSARALVEEIERAVVSGRLADGARLPPVRDLAEECGLAPNTVAAAYRTLNQRGFVVGRGRAGTFVAARPPLSTSPELPVPDGLLDAASGGPDPSLLPDLGPVLAGLDTTAVQYGDDPVEARLLPWALRWSSPPGLTPPGVAVVGGALDGVERVLLAHTRTGDRVAVEDPGYAAVFDLLGALGLDPLGVAIDERGMRPDALAAVLRGSRVAALVLTPRAQNPTGAALDAGRAAELREVLGHHPDVIVIEDDHAGPVAGAERYTVIAEDRAHWASVASVAKSLGPDLRVAFLAGDRTTVERVAGRQQLGTGWVSHLLQRCVATILEDHRTPSLLDHAAQRYAARRARLRERLERSGVATWGRSGLNVWVPVEAEPPVCAAMAQRGWWIRPGHPYRLGAPPAVRISVAALSDEQLDDVAADLIRSVRVGTRRRVG